MRASGDLRAWRWFGVTAVEREAGASVETDRVARLRDVARRLPSGPFSAGQFLDHAIGLNAVANVNELTSMLDELTACGVIRQLDQGERPMWVVTD